MRSRAVSMAPLTSRLTRLTNSEARAKSAGARVRAAAAALSVVLAAAAALAAARPSSDAVAPLPSADEGGAGSGRRKTARMGRGWALRMRPTSSMVLPARSSSPSAAKMSPGRRPSEWACPSAWTTATTRFVPTTMPSGPSAKRTSTATGSSIGLRGRGVGETRREEGGAVGRAVRCDPWALVSFFVFPDR